MIALLMSAAIAAAAPAAPASSPAPTPAPAAYRPPSERDVIDAQFAAPRADAGGGLSSAEADKLYDLYLSRIGQAPAEPSQRGGAAASGSSGSPR